MARHRIDLLRDGRVVALHHDTLLPVLQQVGAVTVTRVTDVTFDAEAQGWRIVRMVWQKIPSTIRPLLETPVFSKRADAMAHEVHTITNMPLSYGVLL